ncbi:MAG: DUF2461 domain-containing protein [Bacteroidales bacterium]|nr:DUF2461 domain-containing protein [Bacteroidales bacterium]
MNAKIIFEFLLDLKFNNNRNWFKENHDRYQCARSEFEQFVDSLIPEIRQIDDSINVTSAKECLFRIFRDVRFSKDKEPYKTNFGAYIAKDGRKSPYAGYYVHFEPDDSFIGGGIYMPEPSILKSIRNRIFENPEVYKNIIRNGKFNMYFPDIYGEQLKTAPKGFPKDFPDIDLLKNKHYAVAHQVSNSFWFEKNVLNAVVDIFKVQYDFNRFLNDIIMKT